MQQPSAWTVLQESCDVPQELLEVGAQFGCQPDFVHRRPHQQDPAIPRGGVDRERRMPHAQARVASLVQILGRATEAVDQEAAQPRLGAWQVVRRIHGPEDRVQRDSAVERGHHCGDRGAARQVVDRQFLGFTHGAEHDGPQEEGNYDPRPRMIFHDPNVAQEAEFDRSLRPATFQEFVGQEQVRENLGVAIAAARERSEPLDHVLLCGPPGLGKTTLAHLVAHGMQTELVITSGPALAAPRDLAGMLTRLQRNQVLFIDEIHRLPRVLEEYLYSAMEDHAIDVVLDSGPGGRSVRLGVQPFTLVGATTREGLLTAAFRSRFGIVERLEPYPPEHLQEILRRAAIRLSVALDAGAARWLAERSRGTPRMSLRILRRVRDLAQVQQRAAIDIDVATQALDRLRIDGLGLEEVDRRVLRALADRGEPIGLKTLAAMVDEAEDTIEEVLEPHLLRCGLIARTQRGRIVTARGLEHLGRPAARASGSDAGGELPFPQ